MLQDRNKVRRYSAFALPPMFKHRNVDVCAQFVLDNINTAPTDECIRTTLPRVFVPLWQKRLRPTA